MAAGESGSDGDDVSPLLLLVLLLLLADDEVGTGLSIVTVYIHALLSGWVWAEVRRTQFDRSARYVRRSGGQASGARRTIAGWRNEPERTAKTAELKIASSISSCVVASHTNLLVDSSRKNNFSQF